LKSRSAAPSYRIMCRYRLDSEQYRLRVLATSEKSPYYGDFCKNTLFGRQGE